MLCIVGGEANNVHHALDDTFVHRMLIAATMLAPRILRGPDLIRYVRQHHLAIGLADRFCCSTRLDILAMLAANRLYDAGTLIIIENVLKLNQPGIS